MQVDKMEREMKAMTYRFLPVALCVMMLVAFSTTAFAQSRARADSQGNIPRVGLGTKKNVIDIPPKAMFYYADGEKKDLEQDFGFLAIAFQKNPQTKDFRHKYYKKLGLVVSELKEETLLKEGIYVIRLVPGATEEKWNIFTQYMYRDSEINYVGRVFKSIDMDNLKVIWVLKGEIKVVFKTLPDIDECRKLAFEFPVTFEKLDADNNTAYYKKRDISIDGVDLANQMFETGRFRSVEPVFIKVKGKAVTREEKLRLNRELLDSAPDRIKEQMERKRAEHMKKMQQKMKQQAEQEKQKKEAAETKPDKK